MPNVLKFFHNLLFQHIPLTGNNVNGSLQAFCLSFFNFFFFTINHCPTNSNECRRCDIHSKHCPRVLLGLTLDFRNRHKKRKNALTIDSKTIRLMISVHLMTIKCVYIVFELMQLDFIKGGI